MDFTLSTFENTTFSQVACPGQDLSDRDFSGCTFRRCDMSGCMFAHAAFADCTFIDCNLSNVRVEGASFQGVTFEGCKLLGIMWSRINPVLVRWSYTKCRITFCDFNTLSLPETRFVGCEIRETDFVGTNLTGSDFSGSDLTLCRFQDTILEKVNFIGATNYAIDPRTNRVKHARFSYPEALSLLYAFDITIE